jgi:hypothetical protein
MLYWPLRSPANASSRLPGGERKNSRVFAHPAAPVCGLPPSPHWISACSYPSRTMPAYPHSGSHLPSAKRITSNVKRQPNDAEAFRWPHSRVRALHAISRCLRPDARGCLLWVSSVGSAVTSGNVAAMTAFVRRIRRFRPTAVTTGP